MEYPREANIMHNPPHPGEILREDYLKPLKLTVTGLAAKLGVSRKVLSEVINEKAGISPRMALKLAKALDTTPQIWLSMQSDYDLWRTMQELNLDDVEVVQREAA